MDNYSQLVGERLKECRTFEGKQQKEVAGALGISQSALSDYENGRAKPSICVLAKAAKYYNVSADYLLGLIREYVPYDRQFYIALPKSKTDVIKQEMLDHLELLKIKHKIK